MAPSLTALMVRPARPVLPVQSPSGVRAVTDLSLYFARQFTAGAMPLEPLLRLIRSGNARQRREGIGLFRAQLVLMTERGLQTQAEDRLPRMFDAAYRYNRATGTLDVKDPAAAAALTAYFEDLESCARGSAVAARAFNQLPVILIRLVTNPRLPPRLQGLLHSLFVTPSLHTPFLVDLFCRLEERVVSDHPVIAGTLTGVDRETLHILLMSFRRFFGPKYFEKLYALAAGAFAKMVGFQATPEDRLKFSQMSLLDLKNHGERLRKELSRRGALEEFNLVRLLVRLRINVFPEEQDWAIRYLQSVNSDPALLELNRDLCLAIVSPDGFARASTRHQVWERLEDYYRRYGEMNAKERVSLRTRVEDHLLEFSVLSGRPFDAMTDGELRRAEALSGASLDKTKRLLPGQGWRQIKDSRDPIEVGLMDLPTVVKREALQIRLSDSVCRALGLAEGQTLWDFFVENARSVLFIRTVDALSALDPAGRAEILEIAGTVMPLVRTVLVATGTLETPEALVSLLAHEVFHIYSFRNGLQGGRRRNDHTAEERNAYLLSLETVKDQIRRLPQFSKSGTEERRRWRRLVHHLLHDLSIIRASNDRLGFPEADLSFRFDGPEENKAEDDYSHPAGQIFEQYLRKRSLSRVALEERLFAEVQNDLGLRGIRFRQVMEVR